MEGDLGERAIAAVERLKDDRDCGAVPAQEGEVEPVVGRADPERQGPAAGRAQGGGDGGWSFHSASNSGRESTRSRTLQGQTNRGQRIQAVSDPDGAPRSFTRRIASSASHRTGLSSYAAACS